MPPLYIHSGVNRPDLLSLLDEEGALGMVNIQVVREPRLQWAFRRFAGVPLFLDSGFRRKMDVSNYVRLIERYGQRFSWIANLDHLFDQQTSDHNYRQITSQLCDAELRSKILDLPGRKTGGPEGPRERSSPRGYRRMCAAHAAGWSRGDPRLAHAHRGGAGRRGRKGARFRCGQQADALKAL